MKQSDKIDNYIKTVCEQIRYKKVHNNISKELKNHIDEQMESYILQGLDEESAINKAIKEMGDPITVGLEFDRVHKAKPEWSLIFITALMILMGLSFTYIIFSSPEVIEAIKKSSISLNSKIVNHLYAILIGTISLVATYFSDYTIIGKYPKTIMISFSFILISILFITNLHYPSVLIGIVSEFKLLFIPLYAGIVYSFRNKGYLGIISSGLFYILVFICCSQIPGLDFTGKEFLTITICCLIIITLAVIKNIFKVKKIVGLLIVYIPTFFTLIILQNFFSSSYRMDRIKAFLNPYNYSDDIGYQAIFIRNQIASSKFLGNSGTEWTYSWTSALEEYTLTYIIVRFGMLFGLIVILAFTILILKMFKASFKQENCLGFLISISITSLFLLQGIFYISSNLGYVLVASSNIPFLSGSFNLIVNMILMGIFLSVFRNGDYSATNKIAVDNINV